MMDVCNNVGMIIPKIMLEAIVQYIITLWYEVTFHQKVPESSYFGQTVFKDLNTDLAYHPVIQEVDGY